MKEAGRKKGYKGEKREGKERNLTEENRVGFFFFGPSTNGQVSCEGLLETEQLEV